MENENSSITEEVAKQPKLQLPANIDKEVRFIRRGLDDFAEGWSMLTGKLEKYEIEIEKLKTEIAELKKENGSSNKTN